MLKNISSFILFFGSMKGKTLLILVAMLLTIAASTGLDFDYNRVRISRDGDYDAIQFPCIGGSNDYDYQFTNIPSGAYANKNKIYVIRERLNTNKFYGFKAIVRDRIQNSSFKKTVFFKISQNTVQECFGAEYDTDISFADQVDRIAIQKRKIISSSSSYVRYENTYETNYQKKYQTEYENKYQSYYEFPRLEEIQEYTSRGDITYIRDVIDRAIESRRTCKEIADYLARCLSTIRAHISILHSQGIQIQKQITIIEEEIIFLRKELEERKSTYIDIKTLKIRIVQFRQSINTLEIERRQTTKYLEARKVQIQIAENQIYELKVTVIVEQQKQITEADQKIYQIDVEIKEIERKLSILRQQRNTYERRRSQARFIIQEREQKINSLNTLIITYQSQIRQTEIRIERIIQEIRVINVRITDIEIEIERGVDISIIREFEQKISSKTILLREKKTVFEQLTIIIDKLNQNIATFENRINKHYYSCYNFVVDGDKQDGTNVEVLDDAFVSYLKQIFGATASSNIRVRLSGSGEKRTIHDQYIFSPAWIRVFGLPFSGGYGNNMDIMETEFSCETLSEQKDDLSVFNGQILNVNKNFITVRDKSNNDYTVHLGGCTRIEIATDKQLPEVGDNIYFKGRNRKSQNKQRHYNGYHVTCY